LERLRDDIDSLLANNSVLGNDQTKKKAAFERVIVSPEVLEKFGLFGHECTSAVFDSQKRVLPLSETALPEEIKKLFRDCFNLSDTYSFVEEGHSLLEKYSEHRNAALIWGLRQSDYDIKKLVLDLLREYYAAAERVLPCVRSLISDDEGLFIVALAIETVGVMGDTSDELIQLITPRLQSRFPRERVVAASNLWRISRSDEAWDILKREAASGDRDAATVLGREEEME
jgi:hypothetical protein